MYGSPSYSWLSTLRCFSGNIITINIWCFKYFLVSSLYLMVFPWCSEPRKVFKLLNNPLRCTVHTIWLAFYLKVFFCTIIIWCYMTTFWCLFSTLWCFLGILHTRLSGVLHHKLLKHFKNPLTCTAYTMWCFLGVFLLHSVSYTWGLVVFYT